MLGQTRGEFTRVFALAAFLSAHVQRLAHKQTRHIPLLRQLTQLLEVLPQAAALECVEALRRKAQFIADCEPNTFLSDIERQDSPCCCWLIQLRIIGGPPVC